MEAKVSVEDWDARWEAFEDAMKEELEQYDTHVAWFAGEFDAYVPIPGPDGQEAKAPVTTLNMVNREVRAWSSWVYLNAPRMVAKAERGFMENNSELADVLTSIGNDIAIKTDLFTEGKRLVQDADMAPFFVAKIGYDASVEVDDEALEKEREEAREGAALIQAGKGPLKARKGQHHSARLEIYRQNLELIEQGQQDMPEDVIEAFKSTIASHEEMREKEGDSLRFETVRDQRVFIRRKNPRAVAFDLWSNDLNSLRWAGEQFKVPIEEVVKHPDNTINEKTVPGYKPGMKLKDWKQSTRPETHRTWDQAQLSAESLDPTPRLTVREMVDYTNMQVVYYCVGAEEPYRVKKYALGKYLQGVPYVVKFIEPHPKKITGISPITAWSDQQKDLTVLNTVVMATAFQHAPGRVFDSRRVDQNALNALQSKVVGRDVGIDKIEPGEDVRRLIAEIPTTKLSPELIAAWTSCKREIEQGSLMGQPRLGGGERTKTATASAIMAESSDRPTKSAANVIDEFFRTLYRLSMRIVKKFYTLNTVVSIGGQKAASVWPEKGFTDSQIMDDRGIDIVVSSMRRQNTDVEMKLLGDLFAVIIRHPAYAQSPALQIAGNRLLDYLMTLYDAPIDLSDIEKMIAQNPQQFSAPPETQSGGGRQPDTGRGSSLNDILQGMKNVGGGRVSG